MKELNGVKLAGTYDFDDEGTPAERVTAVENGVLRNFLMSRMPITGFSNSNGHGRKQAGLMPTGRQGNLIVTSTNTGEGHGASARSSSTKSRSRASPTACTSKTSKAALR